MISVLTLTYKRHHILEEAIQSFLSQDYQGDKEMVIVNDSPDVEYIYHHPEIKIINLKTRFSSIGKKLEYGMKKCISEHVYRLDDDDLLTPWGLSLVKSYIENNPNYDIYRCSRHYFFNNNVYKGVSGSVNNGNCFSRNYINKIKFPDVSIVEDIQLLNSYGAKIYNGYQNKFSMIYRWGMNTFHISGMGNVDAEKVNKQADEVLHEVGCFHLQPHFKNDYYQQIISATETESL